MVCPDAEWLSNADWFSRFRARATQLRIPISGMLELTSRCNLRCVHCYLGNQEQQHLKRDQEMSTEEVKQVIDEMAATGTLFLTITGGDPMMRKDFPEIYVHAKRSGMIVTVFCDGVLVTDKIVELFQQYAPRNVEISLYGATRATYEKITRIKGSYDNCLRGIRRLLDNGISVSLKTVHMSLNSHELTEMERMAVEDFGVKFRMDAAVFPCLPSNATRTESMAPLDLRVTPERAVEMEMRGDRLSSWNDYYERRKDLPHSENLYHCGAAVTGFYVDPVGNLSPCLMTTGYKFSLRDRSFYQSWHEDLPAIRNKKPERAYGCTTCEMQSACTQCPGFNFLETGHEDIKSDYVCQQTQIRFKMLMDFRKNQEHEEGASP